jgi:hypothetical protein
MSFLMPSKERARRGERGSLGVAHLDDVRAVVGGQARRQLVDEAGPLLLLDDQLRAGVLVLERLLEVVARLLRSVRADEPHADLRGAGGGCCVAARPGTAGEHDGRRAEQRDRSELLVHVHSFICGV